MESAGTSAAPTPSGRRSGGKGSPRGLLCRGMAGIGREGETDGERREGKDRTRRQGAEGRAGGKTAALPLVPFRRTARGRSAVRPARARLLPPLRPRFPQGDERLLLPHAGG